MSHKKYDIIIIGAGIYGLYSALYCGKQGKNVLVLDCESEPFARATYINQARVHMGYHYPRSYSTAIKSAGYFERFCSDYGFCNLTTFDQVYATSASFSWTNASDFIHFCKAANIRCDEISPEKYFKPGLCDGTFLTQEYTYDAQILKNWFLDEIKNYSNITLQFHSRVTAVSQEDANWLVHVSDRKFLTPFLLNATYAGVNEIHSLLKAEPFRIKYELCEIILCEVGSNLKNVGITVMDGPFFSIMPFGKTGLHSLTSVTFTPHRTSYDSVATFDCQKNSDGACYAGHLGNCNLCKAKPDTAWPYMSQLARKYLREEYDFQYVKSLFSMKPILQASEVDDSRPTVIRQNGESPKFVSVLSGKINTIYDLDEVLSFE